MIEILMMVGGAVGVGFFLIFLLALADKGARKKRPPGSEPGLSRKAFERAAVEVIERMKLEIAEIVRTEDDNLDIRAKNPTPIVGGEFLVRCVYLDSAGTVTSAEVLEVSSAIIQDRLSKAIFITNGRFAEEIGTLSELAPMEFIDGSALKGLMEKYSVVTAAE